MEPLPSRILSLSLIFFCLAIQHQSQAKPPDTESSQKISASFKLDFSTWQTVSLAGKGIKFKLPPDWRHDEFDLEKKHEVFTIQEIEWNTPNKDIPNREAIRIFTTTYHNGFVSFGHPHSREEMLINTLDRVNRSTQVKDPTFSISDIQKTKAGSVEGVFRVLRLDSKETGPRIAILWTGYRIYQGQAQENDFNISAPLKGEGLLRTIFSTLEIEQDKEPPQSVK